jgi:hypothetical protein
MIRFRVDAVFAVYDGFTGRAITPSTVRVLLDGQHYKPEYREGGYLVFINLSHGEHEMILSSAYFSDETVRFTTGAGGLIEQVVSLKPARNYPFGGETTRLNIIVTLKGLPSRGTNVSLASVSGVEIKIAQDSAAVGDRELRLYFRGGQNRLKLPGEYLIIDGKKSETISLSAVDEGIGRLSAPLINEHARGKLLCPCQSFTTGENGDFTAYFIQPAPIHAFISEKSNLTGMELNAGDNKMEISLT